MADEKEIKKYVDMPHRIELKQSDGGFFVSIPDLAGCFSQANTVEEAYKMILDAKTAWVEDALESGEVIPEPSDEKQYSGKILLRIVPELHAELAQKAEMQGVSLNQYLNYLLTRENERKPITLETHFHKTNIIGKVEVNVEKESANRIENRVEKYA